MTDRYDDTLILGYVEGDLAAADRALFEKQMNEDPKLTALVESLRGDRAALRGMPKVEPPFGLVDAAMSLEERSMLLGDPDIAAATAPGDRQVAARRLRRRRTVGYLAIAAMLMICGGVMLISLSDPWLSSSYSWLGDLGLAIPDRKSASSTETAAAPKIDRDLAMAEAEAGPRSEVLLDEMLTERLEAKRADAGTAPTDSMTATEAPSPPAVAMTGAAEKLKSDGLAESRDRLVATPAAKGRSNEAPMTVAKEAFGARGTVAADEAQVGQVSPEAMEALLADKPTMPSVLVVEVDTDDPESTRREVYAWAISNAALVEAPPVSTAPPGVSSSVAGNASMDVDKPVQFSRKQEAAQQQLTVVLDRRQVPALLDRLNERRGQKASVTFESAKDAAKQDGDDISFAGGYAKPQGSRNEYRMMSDEAFRDVPTASRTRPVETHVARMPEPIPPSFGTVDARITPAEVEQGPPLAARSADTFEMLDYGAIFRQQLSLIEGTPRPLFESENSTRVELRINTIEADVNR